MLNLIVYRDKIKETYLSVNDTEFKILFNSSDWYRLHKKAIFISGNASYVVEGLEDNHVYPLPEACIGNEFTIFITGESANHFKSTEKLLVRVMGSPKNEADSGLTVEQINTLEKNNKLIGTTDISSIAPTITAALSIMSGVKYSRNFTDMGLNSLNFDEEYRFNYTLGLSRNFNESLGTYPTDDDNWFIMQNYCCTHFAMQVMTTVPNTESFIKMYVRTKHVDGGWSLWTQLLTSQTTT